jgi:hypothetical protein
MPDGWSGTSTNGSLVASADIYAKSRKTMTWTTLTTYLVGTANAGASKV